MVTKINTILKQFLQDTHKEMIKKDFLEKTIKENLDGKTKKHLLGARIVKTNLMVYTDSAAGSFQLNLVKNTLLCHLQQTYPAIEKIIIKVRNK